MNNGNLSFDYESNALYYNVKVGADTVRKKCSGGEIRTAAPLLNASSGSTITFNFSDVPGFQSLTTADFNVYPSGSTKIYIDSNTQAGVLNATPTYDSNTGILSLRLVNVDGYKIQLPGAVAFIIE